MFLTAEQFRFVHLTMDLQAFSVRISIRVDDFWAFVHMDLNGTSMSPFVCNMWMIHH